MKEEKREGHNFEGKNEAKEVEEKERKDDEKGKEEQSFLEEKVSEISQILEMSDRLINELCLTIEKIPFQIKAVCRVLAIHTSNKFPRSTKIQIAGFIILRILNPALVSPGDFFGMEFSPSLAQRETLIFLSKILQHLANKTNFKEGSDFSFLNDYLEGKRRQVDQFFEKLIECDIDEMNMKGTMSIEEIKPEVVNSFISILLSNISQVAREIISSTSKVEDLKETLLMLRQLK